MYFRDCSLYSLNRSSIPAVNRRSEAQLDQLQLQSYLLGFAGYDEPPFRITYFIDFCFGLLRVLCSAMPKIVLAGRHPQFGPTTITAEPNFAVWRHGEIQSSDALARDLAIIAFEVCLRVSFCNLNCS